MTSLYERIRKLIFQPKEAWNDIENEVTTEIQLLQNYLIFLVAIPSVFGFLGWLFVGKGLLISLLWAVMVYILTLLGIWLFARSLLFFAHNFECELDNIEASKIASYAYTPVLVASIFFIIPPISWLIVFGAYSFIVLCLGLAKFIQCPSEKIIGMMVSTCITMLIIYLIVNIIAMRLCGFGTLFPA